VPTKTWTYASLEPDPAGLHGSEREEREFQYEKKATIVCCSFVGWFVVTTHGQTTKQQNNKQQTTHAYPRRPKRSITISGPNMTPLVDIVHGHPDLSDADRPIRWPGALPGQAISHCVATGGGEGLPHRRVDFRSTSCWKSASIRNATRDGICGTGRAVSNRRPASPGRRPSSASASSTPRPDPELKQGTGDYPGPGKRPVKYEHIVEVYQAAMDAKFKKIGFLRRRDETDKGEQGERVDKVRKASSKKTSPCHLVNLSPCHRRLALLRTTLRNKTLPSKEGLAGLNDGCIDETSWLIGGWTSCSRARLRGEPHSGKRAPGQGGCCWRAGARERSQLLIFPRPSGGSSSGKIVANLNTSLIEQLTTQTCSCSFSVVLPQAGRRARMATPLEYWGRDSENSGIVATSLCSA